MSNPRLLTARDIMVTSSVTLRPGMGIHSAIGVLLKANVTGCPVTNPDGKLLGILSELDCMKLIASEEFFHEGHSADDCVADYMSEICTSIPPGFGIFRVAQLFFETGLRRIPVLEDGILIGQVTRAGVLRGIQRMDKAQRPRRQFRDFTWPVDSIRQEP